MSQKKFLLLVPLILSIGIIPALPITEAAETLRGINLSERDFSCRAGQTLVFHFNRNNHICTLTDTAKRWVELGLAEIVSIDQDAPQVRMRTPEQPPSPFGVPTTDEMMEHSTISSSIIEYTEMPPTIDPEKGYFVTQIADGLFWLSNGLYQIMFLTTGEGVIVVDAPPSMGEGILSAIDEVTDEPITHVIYSHIHQDHIGAAYIYPEDAIIISHQDTATHLEMKNDPNRPVPTETFDETYTLTVGEQTLELSYEGAFHSKGDIMIFAPKQNVLMVVDHFLPGSTPFKAFALTTDMNNYIAAHDLMIEKDPALIISGHTEILATTDHVKTTKDYTMNVLENAGTAFQTVDFNEIVQQYGSQVTVEAFVAYLDTLTQTCADLTMEEWDGKLDNLGIFVEGHCSEMVLHLMLD